MKGARAVAFFCEDIREEKSEQDTIIGVLPDNMAAPRYPGVAPRLGFYARVHIDPNQPPSHIEVVVKTPWGDEIKAGTADGELIRTAVAQAKKNGLPLAGVVLKALLAPFVMKSSGLTLATINVDGEEEVCAMLNLVLDERL